MKRCFGPNELIVLLSVMLGAAGVGGCGSSSTSLPPGGSTATSDPGSQSTLTATPTPTPVPTHGATPTPTPTPDPNPSPTATPTPTPTPTPTVTPPVLTGPTASLDCGGGVALELVRIPAGTFQMGSAIQGSYMGPAHPVTIGQDFYIGKYVVTQAQYRAVMGSGISSGDKFYGPDKPHYNVSPGQAEMFCQALSARTGVTVRLPTEAEWERACKGNNGAAEVAYFYGDDAGVLGNYAWFSSNSGGVLHEVGQKLPNSFGLYDVHGNILQWCQDVWHGDYTGAAADGSAWLTGGNSSVRVIRGGSFESSDYECRCYFRWYSSIAGGTDYIGFRVVVTQP